MQKYTEEQLTPLIADLLIKFRQCDDYAARLNLWEEYELNKHLFYNIYANDKQTVFQQRSWEEVIQQPILTLKPFIPEEAEEFTEWALRIRPLTYEHSYTFEKKKEFIIKSYTNAPSKADKQFFLQTYKEQLQNLKLARFDHYGMSRSAAAELFNLDISYYIQMLSLLRLGTSVPLAHWIWRRENLGESDRMDWRLIDTYIFADGVVKASAYLEELLPDQPQDIPPRATKEVRSFPQLLTDSFSEKDLKQLLVYLRMKNSSGENIWPKGKKAGLFGVLDALNLKGKLIETSRAELMASLSTYLGFENTRVKDGYTVVQDDVKKDAISFLNQSVKTKR